MIVKPWIGGLEVPWSLIFLPDGRALVSERPGRIRLIKNGSLVPQPYARLDVANQGEGGLMGLALHPGFPREPYVYAMYTYTKKGKLYNKVVRIKDEGDKGTSEKIIVDDILGARNHDGGRIAFGPDSMLYIATGEIFEGDRAQDRSELNGKILRVTPDGGIPKDNPFPDSPIWSYGHRNPQGVAWHPVTKDLFISEHGPSGESLVFGNDEINVVTKGGNYGWPKVAAAVSQQAFIDPIIVWRKATPPAGITFYTKGPLSHLANDLFVATLKSRALIRIKLKPESGTYKILAIERWFATKGKEGKYGRIRDVVQGPDGYLYFTTSNKDGRGKPQENDDHIYRIMPK
ncbi:MAG: PQQ-dependent sugar dehydrogenase [Syntrophorhabdaceae bacterium]